MAARALPPAARRALIVDRLAVDGFVSVADLSAELGVTDVTLRADLDALARAGALRRVHGGALPMLGSVREASVETTAEVAAEIKSRIGRRAAAEVADGNSVLLDVGSTPLAVARALVARPDLTDVVVITNGLSIALALEPAIPRLTVVLTGGTLRPLQHSLVDPLVSPSLAGLHVDLAIIGCTGIDDAGLVSNVNLPETEVKRAMIDASARRVLVADTSKVGRRDLGLVGRLDEFHAWVTDAGPDDPAAELARDAGVELLTVAQS